jgi:hypothetical protein
MTSNRPTYYKGKLTKWLLTVTLFFSIFTFTGYAGHSQPGRQQATQTERVLSNHHKTCKRTISYKKAFAPSSCNDFIISPYKNWTNTLFTYHLLTKVAFGSMSMRFLSQKPARHFLREKTIPQSSDEDIFTTFIG